MTATRTAQPSTASVSPKVARAARKDTLAARLDAILREQGTSRAHLALDLGVCESKLVAWTTAGKGQSIPASDLEALPPLVLRAVLEPLAEQLGLALVERQDAADVGSALGLVSALAVEGSHAVAELAHAVADGTIDAAEGARLAREGTDVERLGRQCRELGERAVRERVVSISEAFEGQARRAGR